MYMDGARLSNFTSGWERHPQDQGIVFVDHREQFLAAARDPSCRATIFRQSADIKKEQAAHLLRKINAFKKTGLSEFTAHFLAPNTVVGLNSEFSDLSAYLANIGALFTEIAGQETAHLHGFINWRSEEGDDNYHKHPAVLNQVFLSQGTLIKTNDGHFQVDKGDILYMDEGCLHLPETRTANNMLSDRITILAIR